MKSTKQTTINETTTSDPNTSPTVIAYRVSQLEITTKEGFKAIFEKLDDIINNFATKGEVSDLKLDHDVRIKELEDWNTWAIRIILSCVIIAVLATVGFKTF